VLCIFCSGIDFVSLQSLFAVSRVYNNNNNNNNNNASIPATKEPSGLIWQDSKRPDGLTLIPWQGGKSLAWDVTVVSTLAQSYVDRAATDVGMVVELAAEIQ